MERADISDSSKLSRRQVLKFGSIGLGATLFAACIPSAPPPAQTETAAVPAPPSEAPVEFDMWHLWSSSLEDPRGQWIHETLELFNSEYPNVSIEPVAYPPAQYLELWTTAVTGDTGPDVAMMWPGQTLLDYRAAWLPIELTDEDRAVFVDLPSVSDNFDPDTGPIYGLPFGVETQFFLYNKAHFAEVGLDPEQPPTTWDEFIQVCEALKGLSDQGIAPLAVGARGGTTVGAYMNQSAAQKLEPNDGPLVFSGEIPFDDPRILGSYQLFAELFQNYAQDGYLSMDFFPDSIDYMAAGRAAMVLGWFSRMVYVAEGLGDDAFGVFKMPTLPEASHPGCVPVGAGGAFVATKWASDPAIATEFVRFTSSKESQDRLLVQTGIIPARTDYDPALVRWEQMNEALGWLSGCAISRDTLFRLPPQATSEMNRQFELLLIGDVSPEQAAEAINAAVADSA